MDWVGSRFHLETSVGKSRVQKSSLWDRLGAGLCCISQWLLNDFHLNTTVFWRIFDWPQDHTTEKKRDKFNSLVVHHIFIVKWWDRDLCNQQSVCFHLTPCLCRLLKVVKLVRALKWSCAVFIFVLHTQRIVWNLNWVSSCHFGLLHVRVPASLPVHRSSVLHASHKAHG